MLGNFAYLASLQLANYIFPLLTIPYLSRILSTEHYGLILFAFSFNAYFVLLCDYGFNLTGTKDIAINSGNHHKLNKLISTITVIKLLLFALSCLLCMGIVFYVPSLKEYWWIYFINLFSLFNSIFFPIWFFQGMEKAGYITLINLVIRSLSVILIFMLIHKDTDFYWIVLINSLTAIVGAIFAQYVLIKWFNIVYIKPTLAEIKQQFKNGWYVFISTLAISLYTISNSFFLGVLTNTVYVAYYANAEKLMSAIQGLLGALSQALFPHISKLINKDKGLGVVALKKALYSIGVLGFFISAFLFISAPFLVKILFGSKYVPSAEILKILSPLPFLVCLSNIFGVQTMLPFGFNKQFSYILISGGLINFSLIFWLVPKFTYLGTAIAVLVTELLITVSMAGYLYKSGIVVWKGKLINV